jgi:hypothetical protein
MAAPIEKELQEYYDNYFTLFSSAGWEQLEKEVIENISQVEQSTFQQSDTNVFLRNQGYVAALRYVASYRNLVDSTWADLNRPEIDDADL